MAHTSLQFISPCLAQVRTCAFQKSATVKESELFQGERVTWAKLAAIRANCGIELTIDSCLAQLTSEVKQQRVLQTRTSRNSLKANQGQGFLRARTPSWINLQAYGEPTFIGAAYASGFMSC